MLRDCFLAGTITVLVASEEKLVRRLGLGCLLVAALLAAGALVGCDDDSSAPEPPSSPAGPRPSGSRPAGTSLSEGDWPTYHHDNARTGMAGDLPPVGTLRRAWQARLDGAVYGQPLVVAGRVFAATENDTVYALDAATGAVRWRRHVSTPVPRSRLPCGNIDPLGITSTMAYDPATGLVFALAETAGGTHTLYGIDGADGQVRLHRVAEPPKGDKLAHQQRSALTVLGGRVYIAYGGLAGDCAQYIGSVVSVPTSGSGSTASYAIPTSREGGIWAPGGAAVAGGQLYYAVGNGESTSGAFDGSDSVIALTPQLKRVDYFAPRSWADDNARDLDLGSMTPAVVGPYLFVAGKRGVGYVLRGDHLGGIGGQVSQASLCAGYGGAAVSGTTVYVPCDDGIRSATVDSSGGLRVGWHGPSRATGAPVVGGGGVWVVDHDGGVLYVLDPASGAVRQRLSIGRAPRFTSPTLAARHAYVATMTGVTAVTWQ
jgi:polyvinyl alcohol dehydrogenase (cytochrome)